MIDFTADKPVPAPAVAIKAVSVNPLDTKVRLRAQMAKEITPINAANLREARGLVQKPPHHRQGGGRWW